MQTRDRMNVRDRESFFAPGEIGRTRSVTPEGYLLCAGVAIARTGKQSYHVSEIKASGSDKALDGDKDGRVIVERLPEEVFRPETMASFNGKSVTVNHPEEFVSPETYSEIEIGTVHNVRRGEGIEDDLLLADLLIKDPMGIAYVNNHLPQVSCGYDSHYVQTEPGHATQVDIVGNHVALVDRGRAGPRCAIKDDDRLNITQEEKFLMATKKVKFVDQIARMFTAFQTKDEAALKVIAAEVGDEDPEETMDAETKKQMKDVYDWMQSCKAKDAAKEKEEEDRKKKEAEDKAAKDAILSAETTAAPDLGRLYTGDALTTVFSRAEILAPGISIPTGDAVKTKGTIESLMARALDTAYATEVGKECVTPFLNGKDLKALTTDTVSLAAAFAGAAELMRKANNSNKTPTHKGRTGDFSKPISVADVQKANDDFWAGRI
jgi:hypothetical protein